MAINVSFIRSGDIYQRTEQTWGTPADMLWNEVLGRGPTAEASAGRTSSTRERIVKASWLLKLEDGLAELHRPELELADEPLCLARVRPKEGDPVSMEEATSATARVNGACASCTVTCHRCRSSSNCRGERERTQFRKPSQTTEQVGWGGGRRSEVPCGGNACSSKRSSVA